MKHRFTLTEKVTVWTKSTILVEAESEAEAKEKIRNMTEEEILDCVDYEGQRSYWEETREKMTPEENNNKPTINVIDQSGFVSNYIYRNA